jgi:hypothetical protein
MDLPELLLEMHARTGSAAKFTHASEDGARAGDVTTSICAVLLAKACNTGFEPLIPLGAQRNRTCDLRGLRSRRDTPALRRYGHERGVTFYNLVSDQPRSSALSEFTGLNGITVPGTLRDSLTLLSVVLEQQIEPQPTEIMSDTGAYTDTIFGFFHLLGFQFSPRLADLGGTRFWRVDGPDGIARGELRPLRDPAAASHDEG